MDFLTSEEGQKVLQQADYLPAMPHPDDFYDPSQHGPELSRGFPGLRVWLSVKLYGAAAFRDAIAEKRALTRKDLLAYPLLTTPALAQRERSVDGTEKFLLRLADGCRDAAAAHRAEQ